MSDKTPTNFRRVNREERRLELIAALKELVAVDGPDVTLRRFTEVLGRSDRYVQNYVGSFADLREAVGLPRRRNAGYSAEFLIEALHKAEKSTDGPVSRRRFFHLTGISPSTCDRVFGSWRECRKAAGLTEVASPGPPSRYSREQLLEMMREQLPILGRRMTRNQFSKAVGVSTATIDRLGSWSELRRELGLSLRGRAGAKSFAEKLGVELFDEDAELFDFSKPVCP